LGETEHGKSGKRIEACAAAGPARLERENNYSQFTIAICVAARDNWYSRSDLGRTKREKKGEMVIIAGARPPRDRAARLI